MRLGLTAALALLTTLAAAAPGPAQWEAAGFGAPRILRVVPDGHYQDQPPGWEKGRLELNFLSLRGSGWTEDHFRAHLDRVAAIYAQCGLRITAGTLIEADAPERRVRFPYSPAPGARGTLEELAARVPLKERPVFLLFAGYTDQTDDRAFSRARWTDGAPGDPVLDDWVFLPAGILTPEYERDRRASPYSTPAHELLHVLTRQGQHVDVVPHNLMNIWLDRTDLILPQDCELVLKDPLVGR